jgi:hypothetical protein
MCQKLGLFEMINLINHKYKYIMQTFEKSGCSTLRNLFLEVHFDEFSQPVQNEIKKQGNLAFHNVQYNHISKSENVFTDQAYKNYYKFSIVRNSYERVISMYFNRVLDVPDFNCLMKSRGPKEDIINRGPLLGITFDQFLLSTINNGDHHFGLQHINENINTYLYLNEINKTLPSLYENVIKIENSKLFLIKKLTQDRKEHPKRKIYKINHKLNNYNFKEDKLNLNIMKDGVPQKNLMITEENTQIIKEKYKKEIDYHNFNYDHLLK